ncbi:DEAD/DEAH box helicase family protein [Brachybacterium sp. J153]|uniref:DEAD/DEAH box helicase family protein n=1 Tax=Brachybacterium sp. J153 TaxID=3116488 RepID=UPI002E799869|nr:DEAD/DEAH box helicase family protein [Brachybacterium sp. J153]MEE1618728.1 DEAD/DEAH box helicase family protein [Brachybacterium sp. J153]
MSNFGFIRAQWPELYDTCQRAESYALSDPDTAAFHARVAVEKVVDYLFVDVFGLPEVYRSDLSARMNDPAFKNRTGAINNQLNLLRRRGNDAAHGNRRLSRQDGIATLRDLFDVIVWTVKHQSTFPEAAPLGSSFDATIAQKRAPLGPAELTKLAQRFSEQQESSRREIAERDEKLSALEEELEALRQQIADAKAADTAADTHDYREDETRTALIDEQLRDAGWALDEPQDREYPVSGLPITPGGNATGTGRVDYVLWGADGLPLGIVEAKRSAVAPSAGEPQARLYADALDAKFGQRPVIFLSNGDRHLLLDDAAGYPAREVAGFFTRGELETMIRRRTLRSPLSGVPVDPAIAGRPYQQRAIAKVGAHFDQKQRRALLVMATGTGKTRTTIALVKQLMEQGWAKRVLFLADRAALVKQAHRAFSSLLPDVASVNLTADKETEARVYLSTYPTMLNLIDAARTAQGRRFGPGFFDLIVIDEAHRSVYQKYGALFDWFDGLLLGLTATPVDDIARSTYRLFELEPGVPTDSYPLDEAIAEGYLVGPENLVYDYGFHRKGIRYDDLPEDEKEKWEEIDWEGVDGEEHPDAEMPTEVEAPRVFRSLFNADTADKVLAELMQHGFTVAGGDRIGKTIVFAMNQRHAQFLKERFDAQYPHLGGDFAQVITSHSAYAQTLIDSFSQPEKAPHIAISVDMLDTGIDVPEVLNLVLFKQVFSKTKFWQMIGRGTRLAPGIFGDGDKESFRVFDVCGNIEYFAQDPADRTASVQISLSQRLFTVRARLVAGIDATAGDGEVRAEAVDWLSSFVAGVPTGSFLARPHRRLLETYSAADGWAAPLTTIAADDVAGTLGALPSSAATDDEHAKRFDLVVLQRELAQLENDDTVATRTRTVMQSVAAQLLEKQTIPQVAAAAELLQDVAGDDFWDDVTLPMLERARRGMRALVQFLDTPRRSIVVTDFEDDLGEARSADLPLATAGVDQKRFREKVTAYIREHRDHVAIQRLRRNMPLTETDLEELERILVEQGEGTPEALASASGERGLGIFVRSLVGLDRAATEAAFAEKIAPGGLNATQQEFLRMVIDELTRRGEMQPERLYQSPYEDRAATRIDIVFPRESEADAVFAVLHDIERAAAPSGPLEEKSLA